jgi:hypothetical protein
MIDIAVKAECTGAGNDQDRHSSDKAIGELRLRSPDRPGDGGQLRHTDHGRHEVAGDLVGQALDRGAAALGLGHELDNLRQHAVAPDLLGLDHPAAGLVHGPTDRLGLDLFGNRHGFPAAMDSSTALRPSTTTPSTGTFSPGRTPKRSPT